jgi:hypothetical protein
MPMFLEDQMRTLDKRKRKRNLSLQGASGKDGRRMWADEELQGAFGKDADCKLIRERLEGASTDQERRNIQSYYLIHPEKVPRIQREKE